MAAGRLHSLDFHFFLSVFIGYCYHDKNLLYLSVICCSRDMLFFVGIFCFSRFIGVKQYGRGFDFYHECIE